MLGSPPCLAVTATATQSVQKDIGEKLFMNNHKKVIYSVDRPMISYHVDHCESINDKLNRLIEIVRSSSGPGMIYFTSRMSAENCYQITTREWSRTCYVLSWRLEQKIDFLIQQQFMNSQLDVICCTSAFGMGLDKRDIRYVIHFHYPTELESYVQEVGGRGSARRSTKCCHLVTL